MGGFGGLFFTMKLTLGRFGRQSKEYITKKNFFSCFKGKQVFMKCKVLIRISSVKKILFIKKNYMLLCSEFIIFMGCTMLK